MRVTGTPVFYRQPPMDASGVPIWRPIGLFDARGGPGAVVQPGMILASGIARPAHDIRPANRAGVGASPAGGMMDNRELENQVDRAAARLGEVQRGVAEVIVGQERLVESLLVALLCRGHVLLEGVPGLAKTLTVRTLAAVVGGSFARLQFTPDLLPADVTGTQVFDPRSSRFVPHRGPVFANLVLADEINRAPAKVQSALLEAMEERQVTIGETSHRLPSPFVVLATQNPIEQEGTYPLPEAQLDRFLFKVMVGYPTAEEERRVLELHLAESFPTPTRVTDLESLVGLEEVARQVYLDERIRTYIVSLVAATRRPAEVGLGDLVPLIGFGASPRASIALALATRAQAMVRGRAFVTPEDVKELAPMVLRHRIVLTYEAEAEGVNVEEIVDRMLLAVEVP
jgi:MoxR-like ATPase